MYRLLALLALAVCNLGCSACGGPGYGGLWGCGAGCGNGSQCCDECGCGCEDPCACGGECCDTGCCGDCGCEPTCGCGSGQCADGCCGHMLQGCPICEDCRNCKLFQRGGGACCGCGNCGGECGGNGGPCAADYDYSACNQCGGQGCGYCCGCCETYSGCCCQPQGPGCCASGDQHYNFAPGPPVGQTAYPYYTVRGPRDFLQKNPAPIGPY